MPAETGVMIPELLIVAIPVEILDQEPPIVNEDKVDVSPIQISVFPVIGDIVGLGFTTILPVAYVVPQPPERSIE